MCSIDRQKRETSLIRPTTKDLAAEAGVSLATVDRVLNNRPNVSEKARKRVNEAIEKTGFVRNMAAVNLGRNKPYRFKFLVPERGDQYLKELLNHVEKAEKALKGDMTFTEAIQLPMNDPHSVANFISQLDASDLDGAAIMAPESPQVRDAIGRLHERGVAIVQFLSGQEELVGLDFVGINNFAAGATAARISGRFLNGVKGKIMVVAETMQALDSIERRFGFDNIINSEFKNLSILPSLETYGDPARAKKIISNQLKNHPDICAIYVLSSEARLPIEILDNLVNLSELVVVAHEKTPFSSAALKDGRLDAVISQDPGHAVRSAVRILRARNEQREPLADQEKIRIEIILKDNL